MERKIGSQIVLFNEIDSTNDHLKSNYESLAHGYTIWANHQTMGKGRLGRKWVDKVGDSLLCSILIKPEFAISIVSSITLFCGICICNVIRRMGVDAKVKWPNDIVVGKKKLAGILVESGVSGDSFLYVVIGFGINVNNEDFTMEIKDTATSLKILGVKVDREELLREILKELDENYSKFTQNGLLSFMGDINNHSATKGRNITILKGGKETSGEALEILVDGSLLVKVDDEEIVVKSGEVTLRGVNGYV